nr:MAG TPA: hypothetical protein [Caudoviricetes sp.]
MFSFVVNLFFKMFKRIFVIYSLQVTYYSV